MPLNTDEIRRLARRYHEDGIGGLVMRDTVPAMCDEIDRLRSGMQLTVPDEAWTNTNAPDEAPRLLTTVVINGTLMHLEAIAVHMHATPPETTPIQEAVNSDEDEDLGLIFNAVAADGPWDTTTIDGREYVLIATPHS